MRLGVLFSGGKDSTYAMFKAMKEHKVVCLMTVVSENPESYMFHTPNIHLTELQAEAIGLPLITAKTKGEKEKELVDLKNLMKKAKELFHIEGVVTGAIASVYQTSRIQKICSKLKLECVNPLWGMNQIKLLNELIENKFEVIIVGVFAYQMDDKWLGRKLDYKTIDELNILQEKYKINPAGEGGEIETLVVNAPFFKKRINIVKSSILFKDNSGILKIEKAILE
jgi:ABC transporter with metal-binding/Fe-S-binding domain ATP-binding protein